MKRTKDTNQLVVTAPDADTPAWRERLGQILGTASSHFIDQSLRQIVEACRLPYQCANTTSVSAALELIASLEPQNAAQAAMAIHVACLHCASINVMSKISGVTERHTIAMATAAAKIERAFQLALDSYHRLKTGAHQVVRVERMAVQVQPGGQALIGVTA